MPTITITLAFEVTWDAEHETEDGARTDLFRILEEAEQAGFFERQTIEVTYGEVTPADKGDSVKSTTRAATRTVRLPDYGIVVEITGGSGTITSDLHVKPNRDDPADDLDTAFDGIESMILAHAIAGIDVTSAAYMEGVRTAIGAATNALT